MAEYFYNNFEIGNLRCEIDGVSYEEEWRDIKGYNGIYGVSSFGRIYSMREDKIMKQWINDSGYLTISLHKNGRKKFKVHRLVGIMFIPNPQIKPEINHDDFDKLHNHFTNLFWVTGKENLLHAQLGGKIGMGNKPPKPKVGEHPIRCQKIVDTNSGIIYDNVFLLSEETNIPVKTLRRMMSGERRNLTSYEWLKGQYTLFYKKRHDAAMVRYNELLPKIYGVAI